MKNITVEEFTTEVEAALKIYFESYDIQILFQTEKSFKANIYLEKGVFIAVRYNSRNERMDFALIKDNGNSSEPLLFRTLIFSDFHRLN